MPYLTEGNVTIFVEQGYNVSWEWTWTYGGEEPLPDVHEEMLILDPNRQLINAETYGSHTAEPGMTYLGSGRGLYPLNPYENAYFDLRVFRGGEYLADIVGSAYEVGYTLVPGEDPPPDPQEGYQRYDEGAYVPPEEGGYQSPEGVGSEFSDAAEGASSSSGYEQQDEGGYYEQDPGAGWTSG
jgi:hypothetical protein